MAWLELHAAVLTLGVAFVAIVVAWLIYRLDEWSERAGLIRAIDAELSGHRDWVGNQYPTNLVDPQWADPTYMVYKLSTVAIESGISRGPALFVRRELVPALVRYRQRIETFNQYVDASMIQQAATTAAHPVPRGASDRTTWLTTALHQRAIGVRGSGAAYTAFEALSEAISAEKCSSPRVWLWAIVGR